MADTVEPGVRWIDDRQDAADRALDALVDALEAVDWSRVDGVSAETAAVFARQIREARRDSPAAGVDPRALAALRDDGATIGDAVALWAALTNPREMIDGDATGRDRLSGVDREVDC
jgi:hypothetical protein